MKAKKITLYIIGGGLLLYGLILLLISGWNFGFAAVGGIGAVLLAGGIWYEKIPLWMKAAALGGLAIWLGLAVFLFGYGWTDTVDYQEDAVIVLGAGLRGEEPSRELKSRLNCAIDYFKKNPDAVFVVSGGMGDKEHISEAEAMARYLLEAGLPESQIIREDQSANTLENFTFSKELLDARLGEQYRVAFITNDFHVFRASMIASDIGFEDAHHLYGATPFISILPCGLREGVALMKYIVF